MHLEERLKQDNAVDPLFFYGPKNEHGIFSNFSKHPVELTHPFQSPLICRYQTVEHRYQALKATNALDHDWVASASTAGQSKDRGRSIALRDDWGNDYREICWYVMFEAVMAKSLQNPAVLKALADTYDRTLYEDSPTDDIWGIRFQQDYRGKNLLGRCLMEVRSLLCD